MHPGWADTDGVKRSMPRFRKILQLILRDAEGTLVFVEVRRRKSSLHGTAAASVGRTKQRRVVLAAQHYLLTVRTLPPCRFDVVEVTPEGCHWLRAAFDAH